MQKLKVREKVLLLDYLLRRVPGIKRSTAKQYLKFRAVRVNGTPATRHDHPLSPGDEITIKGGKTPAEGGDSPKIIYEDEAILTAEKPAGLLTIATEKIKTRTAYYELTERLKPKRERVFIVHRLDREVSGLVVFAKTPFAKKWLQENWRQAEKKYFAVVSGVPDPPEGMIESCLAENRFLRVYSTPKKTPDSKYSVTSYKTLETGGGFSLLDIHLHTGRKHQIRVHLADHGCPIVGDDKYGNTEKGAPALLENGRPRLALHAYCLSLDHPVSRRKMKFETRIPPCFEDFMRKAKQKTCGQAKGFFI